MRGVRNVRTVEQTTGAHHHRLAGCRSHIAAVGSVGEMLTRRPSGPTDMQRLDTRTNISRLAPPRTFCADMDLARLSLRPAYIGP